MSGSCHRMEISGKNYRAALEGRRGRRGDRRLTGRPWLLSRRQDEAVWDIRLAEEVVGRCSEGRGRKNDDVWM